MKKTLITLVFVAATALMSVASTDALPDTIVLDEISVSAIKQGVSNDDASSTMVSQKDLEQHRIVTVKGVSDLIPNFYIPDYGSRITSSIYVRGIGARMDQPSVGLNIDNVPIMNKDAYDFDLVDIAKVEMLRGPQSSLYGRNTMGGLINVTTLSPMKWQGFRLMAEYGSGNSWKGAASWYHKFSDKVGLSVSAYYTSTDGFFVNQFNGEKCDWERQFSAKTKLEWKVSDKVLIQNVLSASNSNQGGYPYEYIATKTIAYNDTCFYKRFTLSDGLTLRWFTDDFSLSSITSVQYLDDNMTLDQDFRPLEYFTLTQAKKELALTQDLVIKGNDYRNYKWLVGAFGFYKDLDMVAPVTFKDYGINQLIIKNRNDANPHYPIEWESDNFLLNSDFVNRTYGAALYHQSSYDLERWHFKLGIRFDYEYTTLNYHSYCSTGYDVYKIDANTGGKEFYRHTPIEINERNSLSDSFFELLPRLSVSYDLDVDAEANLYASASKGYKAGGFNTQMFSDFLQQKLMGQMGIGASYDIQKIVGYRPEESWNYEIGGHVATLDRKLSADVSIFYIDCRDQQLTMFPDGTTTGRVMTNAGKTRSFGAEASVKFSPIERLSFNLSYGYTNAKFREFNNGKEDFAGKYLPYVPQHTAYIGAIYSQPIKTSWLKSIDFDVNARGIGKIYWDEANRNVQNFYTLLNASVTFDFDVCTLQLWGNNLTDAEYSTFYFVSIGNEFLQRGKPTTLGATLRVNI